MSCCRVMLICTTRSSLQNQGTSFYTVVSWNREYMISSKFTQTPPPHCHPWTICRQACAQRRFKSCLQHRANKSCKTFFVIPTIFYINTAGNFCVRCPSVCFMLFADAYEWGRSILAGHFVLPLLWMIKVKCHILTSPNDATHRINPDISFCEILN